MDLSTVINALFLCVLNAFFMIAGIFLNSVVIISLWRSSQLRKKLCYFTIFVLCCFDLAVVAIAHPLQISSTISVLLGKYNGIQENIRTHISIALNGFSMFSLLVLNIERFLALTYPFFSSNISYETETYKSSVGFDDFTYESVVTISFEQHNGQNTINGQYWCIFIVVYLLKLQNVYNCELKTRKRNSCKIKSSRKKKAQVTSQTVLHLLIDSFLLFRLFVAICYISCITFNIK